MKHRIESWKITVSFREDDFKRETYFSTRDRAKSVLEEAVKFRKNELENRSDIYTSEAGVKIEECRTSYDDDAFTVKLIWWKVTPAGFVAMKDYIYFDYDLFEREVVE